MAKLLYIEASPMDELSYSSRVAQAFLDAYRAARPADQVETLNIWNVELPVFDGEGVRARYKVMRGLPQEATEAEAWRKVTETVEHFKGFDSYLISTPMWNFSIPWRLKQYLDLLAHPGLTFSFSPETGYQGLVVNRKAVVVCARGGVYPVDTPWAAWDFQRPYLRTFLGFIGITDVTEITVEGVLQGGADEKLAAAQDEARKVAAAF